jgi:Txe/YoeB family toxin of Txe-Axe toxin-antitoxin module
LIINIIDFVHRAEDRAVTIFMNSAIAERVAEMLAEITKTVWRHRQKIGKNSRDWKDEFSRTTFKGIS